MVENRKFYRISPEQNRTDFAEKQKRILVTYKGETL